jgi:hypothetical protein
MSPLTVGTFLEQKIAILFGIDDIERESTLQVKE